MNRVNAVLVAMGGAYSCNMHFVLIFIATYRSTFSVNTCFTVGAGDILRLLVAVRGFKIAFKFELTAKLKVAAGDLGTAGTGAASGRKRKFDMENEGENVAAIPNVPSHGTPAKRGRRHHHVDEEVR